MEQKDRTITVAIIIGVVALLLGCCLGALFGVTAGILIGHTAAIRPAERIILDTPKQPETPEQPLLPDLPGGQGAVVQEVVAGSSAADAGVAIGDIITSVDGTVIDANHGLADVVSHYQPGDRIKIAILRAGAPTSITATLGENPQDRTRPYLGVRYADFTAPQDDSAPKD